jgi:hypothetical protein
MRMTTGVLRNGVFAVLTAASLGFGVSAAFARPAAKPQESRYICPFMRTEEGCIDCCFNHGFPYYYYNASTGECRCSTNPFPRS